MTLPNNPKSKMPNKMKENNRYADAYQVMDCLFLDGVKEGATLYHYTKFGTLSSILQNDKIELWTTHHAQLNDYSELYWGLKINSEIIPNVKTLRDKIKPDDFFAHYENSHITCFSKYGNSLPMWNMYAGDCGISLGFDNMHNCSDFLLMNVAYGSDEWQTRVDKFRAYDSRLIAPFLVYAPYMIKHPAFEYEQEVRAVVENPTSVFEYDGRKHSTISINKSCLSRIFVGPCDNFDEISKNIQQLLSERGYENVDICRSFIPLRINKQNKYN